MATKPKTTFRAGACSASVFINNRQTAEGSRSFPSVSLSCRYKDEETGEWKDASSMSPNEVAKAIVVLRRALEYCWLDLEPKKRKTRKK